MTSAPVVFFAVWGCPRFSRKTKSSLFQKTVPERFSKTSAVRDGFSFENGLFFCSENVFFGRHETDRYPAAKKRRDAYSRADGTGGKKRGGQSPAFFRVFCRTLRNFTRGWGKGHFCAGNFQKNGARAALPGRFFPSLLWGRVKGMRLSFRVLRCTSTAFRFSVWFWLLFGFPGGFDCFSRFLRW